MRSLQEFLLDRRIAEAKKDKNRPLTPEEERLLGRANVFLMDYEADGGTLPREVERLSNLRRRLKPAEARVILDFFRRNAPGDYG